MQNCNFLASKLQKLTFFGHPLHWITRGTYETSGISPSAPRRDNSEPSQQGNTYEDGASSERDGRKKKIPENRNSTGTGETVKIHVETEKDEIRIVFLNCRHTWLRILWVWRWERPPHRRAEEGRKRRRLPCVRSCESAENRQTEFASTIPNLND